MKKIALLIAIFMVLGSAPVFAQTPSTTTQVQVDAINSLTTQIQTLQAERRAKLSELVTQLRQGTRS